MDFTLVRYSQLLKILLEAGYTFQTFGEFIKTPVLKAIILRHDVDKLPLNSFKVAQIEHKLGIRSSYYFRMKKTSFKKDIIMQINTMGHEIGYHYETMDTCNGNIDEAYREFCINLEIFRGFNSIKTICMHGSPLSRHDNRDLWKKYDYRTLGIVGEPYFDINYSKVLYLTDTGRCWNGDKKNIRDKEQKSTNPILSSLYNFASTKDLINAVTKNNTPPQIFINTHPQRWSDNSWYWAKEYINQNTKNQVKKIIVSTMQGK